MNIVNSHESLKPRQITSGPQYRKANMFEDFFCIQKNNKTQINVEAIEHKLDRRYVSLKDSGIRLSSVTCSSSSKQVPIKSTNLLNIQAHHQSSISFPVYRTLYVRCQRNECMYCFAPFPNMLDMSGKLSCMYKNYSNDTNSYIYVH